MPAAQRWTSARNALVLIPRPRDHVHPCFLGSEAGVVFSLNHQPHCANLVFMKHNIALDTATLQAALLGYQHQKDEIDGKIAEIRKRIGGRDNARNSSAAPVNGQPRKRKLSAAARKRIAAGQRKRWAAFHKAKEQ